MVWLRRYSVRNSPWKQWKQFWITQQSEFKPLYFRLCLWHRLPYRAVYFYDDQLIDDDSSSLIKFSAGFAHVAHEHLQPEMTEFKCSALCAALHHRPPPPIHAKVVHKSPQIRCLPGLFFSTRSHPLQIEEQQQVVSILQVPSTPISHSSQHRGIDANGNDPTQDM